MTAIPIIPPDSVLATVGGWFGPIECQLMGWLTSSKTITRDTGILILPSIGYEYWTSHRTLRTLAESLANRGHLVLRMDYEGTGDSSGDQADILTVGQLSKNVDCGVQELYRLGARSVSIVGLRMGALLALEFARIASVNAVVAWITPSSGRKYVKELRLLSTAAPDGLATLSTVETRFLVGTAFSRSLFDSMTEIKAEAETTSARKIFFLDRDDRPLSSDLVRQYKTIGIDVKHEILNRANSMLDVPTEDAVAPAEHINSIVQWLDTSTTGTRQMADFDLNPVTQLQFEGTQVWERLTYLGADRLVAIESSPFSPKRDAVTVVFLNTGSEHHVGSGRVWVEFARRLAANGDVAIRIDFRGWGESPDAGFAPGRPYDLHVVEDVRNIARALRDRGDRKIVLVGLCAGAWAALRECWLLPVDGVIAFNPQLYWQPGDPVEALLTQTRVRRTKERTIEENLGKFGIWTAFDMCGFKGKVGRWLWRIARAPFPVAFLFAKGDDGIEYLQNRLERRLRKARDVGRLKIVEIEGIDHPMHRHWYRQRAYSAMHDVLRSIR